MTGKICEKEVGAGLLFLEVMVLLLMALEMRRSDQQRVQKRRRVSKLMQLVSKMAAGGGVRCTDSSGNI